MLSELLQQMHQRTHVQLTASGTSALVLSCQVLGLSGKRVAIPNNVCISVSLAVFAAGATPLFLDAEPTSQGLSLSGLMKHRDDYDGVIAVHNYGAVCDIVRIAEFCKAEGKVLIEDCAVAQGAMAQGVPVGSFGDISILSFGAGKIVDVGYGGAVMTNSATIDSAVAACIGDLASGRDARIDLDDISHYHTDLYNRWYGVSMDDLARFAERGHVNAAGVVAAFDPDYEEAVERETRALARNIAARRDRAEQFATALEGASPLIDVFTPPAGSVYWRFCIFIDSGRDMLLKCLLKKRYKVSSWHPSADRFWAPRRTQAPCTPVSDAAGDRILNLWVNREVDDEYVDSISSDIVEWLKVRC